MAGRMIYVRKEDEGWYDYWMEYVQKKYKFKKMSQYLIALMKAHEANLIEEGKVGVYHEDK